MLRLDLSTVALGATATATTPAIDSLKPKWEFPKIRGTILGVPVIRTILFLGLYWGPLIMGNYQILMPKPQAINIQLSPKPNTLCLKS